MATMTDLAPESLKLGGKAAKLVELRAAGFPVPDFLISPIDLKAALATLGFPVAVRSSASTEDGAELSYAGLFRSFLNLTALDEVRAAVTACQDSLASEAVQFYCQRHGQSADAIRLDVIIQKMIRPELAGVAFSLDPVTGAERIRIEACAGTAEKLLAGEVNPLPPDHPLLRRYRSAIEELVWRLQLHFGAPQDVEFAIEDGTVYLLQSRPITRVRFQPAVGEWTTAMFRDGGVANGVCSPLMWSLYQPVWDEALQGTLRELRLLRTDFETARLFFGRPYWNLGAVKDCLLRLPGFSEAVFHRDLCIPASPAQPGRRTPKTFANILKAAPALLAIARLLRRQPQEAEALLRIGSQRLSASYSPDRIDPLGALRRLVGGEYRQIERTYFRSVFAVVLAKMDFLIAFPDADYPRLMTNLPEPRYITQIRELKRTSARSVATPAALIQAIAHHGSRGLDVSLPRWDEEPDWMRELLQHAPSAPPPTASADYQQARSRACAALSPWSRWVFTQKLDRLRRLVWLREELRDLSNQAYYHIRRLAQRIAEERGLGDDIFLLTFSEILNNDQSHLERNREATRAYRNYAAPAEVNSLSPAMPAPASNAISGLGVSPGVVTGPAWVATSLREANLIPPGSILVCRFIDPSWVPVLDRVAGVVAESGGVLSHAAVIAREYGIPAILGVAAATRLIQTGVQLRVRGDQGVVEVIACSTAEPRRTSAGQAEWCLSPFPN